LKTAAVLHSARLPFLLLTPVCVFLGASLVMASGIQINHLHFMLILLGSVLAHVSVNMLNEYHDFSSGLDLKTEKTPFSGGSGSIPANPEIAPMVMQIGYISLAVTLAIGLYFVYAMGLALLPVGIAGALLIITYTNQLNRMPLLCLVAPGLGFGLFMVMGTQFVLSGSYNLAYLTVAAVPFFLVNNLLLLNQYPDIAADASVGRNHLPIAYGITVSNFVYVVFVIAAALFIVVPVRAELLPQASLLALIPLLPTITVYRGMQQYRERIGDKPVYLALNVAASLLTPLILALTIAFAG
jgi:1,4-dihydroxy-2-naphthoate octaprenyltransferase